jgi:hypothetical protein
VADAASVSHRTFRSHQSVADAAKVSRRSFSSDQPVAYAAVVTREEQFLKLALFRVFENGENRSREAE